MSEQNDPKQPAHIEQHAPAEPERPTRSPAANTPEGIAEGAIAPATHVQLQPPGQEEGSLLADANTPHASEPPAASGSETDGSETNTAAPSVVAETISSASEADREQKSRAADAQVLANSRQHTRRSFLGAAAAVTAGYGFYHYLNSAPAEDMQPVPLENAYKFSASVSRAVFLGEPLAPTYPFSRAETLRINGIYGLKKDIVPETWRLQLVGMKDAAQHPRFVSDVTAWEYQYQAPPANDDKGHDTKVDPTKEAHAQPAGVPSTEALPVREQALPGTPLDNGRNSGRSAPRTAARAPMTDANKPDEKIMSSMKMAPAAVLQQAMNKEAGMNDDGSDDNHTGRKPRGSEEAGESDSTLPPHTPGLLLELADVTRLPRVELITQFKCIEGWSQIVHWAGVRMADFLELYPPALINGTEPRYVYMETPDGDYYTGYDLHIMRHPQTLLVTEMMGAALTQKHGAPLRLHMPTKYGYKQIKRIGLIAYTNTRPDDYWTKLGYDWYAGL